MKDKRMGGKPGQEKERGGGNNGKESDTEQWQRVQGDKQKGQKEMK